MIKLVLIVGGVLIAILTIVGAMITSTLKVRYRERVRSEIAAYVAEGSIKPQDAAILMAEGFDDLRREIASGVAWGTIKPADAERLIAAVGRPQAGHRGRDEPGHEPAKANA